MPDGSRLEVGTTGGLATELMPRLTLSIGDEAETWLRDLTEVSPEQPIDWCPHGHRDTAVRNVEHLAVLVSSLPRPGEWAVIEWAEGKTRPWCQTMRYPTGWVVDAHAGPPDDWAKRVFRGSPGDYPKPSGLRPAFDFELWQPFAAADLIWSWLHGSLPEGCSRTMRHMIDRCHDHGLG